MIPSRSWKWDTPDYVDRPSHQVELIQIKEELDKLESAEWFLDLNHHIKTEPPLRTVEEVLADNAKRKAELLKRRREILASYGHEDEEQTAEVVEMPNANTDLRDLRILTRELESIAASTPEVKAPKVPWLIRHWWLLPVASGLVGVFLYLF